MPATGRSRSARRERPAGRRAVRAGPRSVPVTNRRDHRPSGLAAAPGESPSAAQRRTGNAYRTSAVVPRQFALLYEAHVAGPRAADRPMRVTTLGVLLHGRV